MLHEKTQANILLEVDLSVCPERYYYYYYYYTGCGRLQQGVDYWDPSVVLQQVVVIDPTNSGSRFSSGDSLP